jgi:glycine/D-amino acid oxidase-like deaminating enzyme
LKTREAMQKVEFPPSIWASTAPPRTPAKPLNSDTEADIVIVGGGFTGLSAALHLAKRGKRVILLEGNAVGWGASGRNNGQVIPTMTSAEPDAITKRYGASGERFARLIGNSADILFSIVRDENIEAEAEQKGWLRGAFAIARGSVEAVRLSSRIS